MICHAEGEARSGTSFKEVAVTFKDFRIFPIIMLLYVGDVAETKLASLEWDFYLSLIKSKFDQRGPLGPLRNLFKSSVVPVGLSEQFDRSKLLFLDGK